jgi:hypothetical protein
VILFSLIWIIGPISYDKILTQYQIYLKEDQEIVDSSFIPTQKNDFQFLKSNTKRIIFAKDTSKSFSAEGFTPPLPREPSSIGSQIATGMSESNSSQGGENSSPDSGSEVGSYSSTPTPKIAPEINHFTPKGKKKKNDQCPLDSIGKVNHGRSSEIIINSNYQDQKAIIMNIDVKKFITRKDRNRFEDQKFNENIYKNEIGIRAKFPDEVYTKNYKGKLSTIYPEKLKAENIEPIITIVDNKSGRLKLNSSIITEEY